MSLLGGRSPTGTMTFRLYGPQPEYFPLICTGSPLQTVTVPVDGNGIYATDDIRIDAVGVTSCSSPTAASEQNAPLNTWCGQQRFEVLNGPVLKVDAYGSREVGAPLTIAPAIQAGAAPSGGVTTAVFGPSDPRARRRR